MQSFYLSGSRKLFVNLDTEVFLFVQQFTGNQLVDSVFLFLAEYLAFLIPLSLIYLWFRNRAGREDSVITFASTVLGIASTYILGLFYFHNQPFASYETIVAGGELDNAFPSQHTAAVFSCFWSFIYLEREKLAAGLGLAAVLTGFSRVFVGLHYPVDIVGGAFSGLIGLGITIVLYQATKEKFNIFMDLTERIPLLGQYLVKSSER